MEISITTVLIALVVIWLFFGEKKTEISENERRNIEMEARMTEKVRRMMEKERKRDRHDDYI